MDKRYSVVTWSDDVGTDERMDYTRKADAIKEARSYNGKEEYAAIYDRKKQAAFVVFGGVKKSVFSVYVSVEKLKQ